VILERPPSLGKARHMWCSVWGPPEGFGIEGLGFLGLLSFLFLL
jgi:hypothetical protein